jgi:hypothetical protein
MLFPNARGRRGESGMLRAQHSVIYFDAAPNLFVATNIVWSALLTRLKAGKRAHLRATAPGQDWTVSIDTHAVAHCQNTHLLCSA